MSDRGWMDLLGQPFSVAVVRSGSGSKMRVLECDVCGSRKLPIKGVLSRGEVQGFICQVCADNAKNGGLSLKEAIDAKQ